MGAYVVVELFVCQLPILPASCFGHGVRKDRYGKSCTSAFWLLLLAVLCWCYPAWHLKICLVNLCLEFLRCMFGWMHYYSYAIDVVGWSYEGHLRVEALLLQAWHLYFGIVLLDRVR